MNKCEFYKKRNCKYEKDGICGNYKSKDDNLSLHCSGSWSEDKIKHFKYYSEMFATGMKNKWSYRYYIDLFSGPGKCIVRENLKEINGSCLEAINLKDKFTEYFLIDKNNICINALKERLEKYKNINYYNDDCNNIIEQIIKKIPDKSSLGLAIIDPDSLQFHFDSYEKLSKKKIDLIVNYPIGSIERAVSSVLKKKSKSEKLDKFHPGWREIVNKRTWGYSKRENIKNLIKDYINKIKNLGYYSSELVIPFKNTKNSTMYYLIAFSKDKMGIDFWNIKTNSLKKKNKGTLSLLDVV